MKQYGVLVVDDSAFMRKTISSIIEASPDLYVAGRARNGVDAMQKIEQIKPDVITLDIEMPLQDGIETLKQIMQTAPTPVIMLSNGADSSIECLELGAVDFVIKSELIEGQEEKTYLKAFHKRLITAACAKLKQPNINEQKDKSEPVPHISPIDHPSIGRRLIIIGSSTGGPAALQQILTQFDADFPIPILIVQHMPPGFTKHLAERFQRLCKLKVKEAEENETLEAGTIYIAPSGLQTTLKIDELNHICVKLKTQSVVDTLYKPSLDVTLLSIAPELKDKLLTVVLTGMGDDGLRGCREVKKYNGFIISESKETCVVYGMPKVVYEAGLTDRQSPLYRIYDAIIENS